ncbi:MAG: hypothetical protein LBL26_11765, partial [Peptococcaceae bacterium]|nr:hypothetical protein [Peptococcaceae bacterium]
MIKAPRPQKHRPFFLKRYTFPETFFIDFLQRRRLKNLRFSCVSPILIFGYIGHIWFSRNLYLSGKYEQPPEPSRHLGHDPESIPPSL